LRADGATVVRIGRGADADVHWDPARGVLDARTLEGIDAVVHLAGAPIAQRWTARRKREIHSSRVESTALLARTIASLSQPPAVLMCSSAIGFYGDRGDEQLTESSSQGSGFLADVVVAWEDATRAASDGGVRVVNARTGIVLSPDGGALKELLLPFRLGVGGPAGDGCQWMSWVSLRDVVGAMRFAMTNELRGPVNMVAPAPVRNAEFSRMLGRALHRPAFFRVPAFVLRALFGEMASQTLLASQRVAPERLQAAGFAFADSTLEGALLQLL
jgi:hypothetical protein